MSMKMEVTTTDCLSVIAYNYFTTVSASDETKIIFKILPHTFPSLLFLGLNEVLCHTLQSFLFVQITSS